MAKRLGGVLGVYEEFDNKDCNKLGRFLRLKAVIDVRKALKRGTIIRYQEKDIRIVFRYETSDHLLHMWETRTPNERL
jgi:hypothetical protein